MKRKILVVGIIILLSVISFSGCTNNTETTSDDSAQDNSPTTNYIGKFNYEVHNVFLNTEEGVWVVEVCIRAVNTGYESGISTSYGWAMILNNEKKDADLGYTDVDIMIGGDKTFKVGLLDYSSVYRPNVTGLTMVYDRYLGLNNELQYDSSLTVEC